MKLPTGNAWERYLDLDPMLRFGLLPERAWVLTGPSMTRGVLDRGSAQVPTAVVFLGYGADWKRVLRSIPMDELVIDYLKGNSDYEYEYFTREVKPFDARFDNADPRWPAWANLLTPTLFSLKPYFDIAMPNSDYVSFDALLEMANEFADAARIAWGSSS